MAAMLARLRMIAGVAAVALVFTGAYVLDVLRNLTWGYAFLLAGASLLVFVPGSMQVVRDAGGRPHVGRLRTAVLLVLAGAALNVYVARSVGEHPTLSAPMQLFLWFVGSVCVVLAGRLWDRRRHPEPFPIVLDRSDWSWMVGLFVVGSAVRICHLAVEPPGLSADETIPMAITLRFFTTPNSGAFWTYEQGFTGLYHCLAGFFITYMDWLGLDTVQTAKLPVALFGGFSIAALYAAIRLLDTRRIAATAAVFLLWQGWHWVLSRFYYRYGGDLTWISLTTAFLVAGIRSGRLSLMAAAGLITGIGTTWLNAAVMLAPWGMIVLLDHALGERRGGWRTHLIPAAVWGLSFAISVIPLGAQVLRQPSALWRFHDVSVQRAHALEQMGLTSLQGYYRGLLGAARALQISEAGQDRETIRPNKPALDPVQSALATVGLLWCAFAFRRARPARICLLGFLLFLWPAVSSYPVDGDVIVPRRMVGSTLFIAWMAAYGAAVVAERVAPERRRFAAMLAMAVASLLLNASYVRATYNKNHWYDEYGVHKVYFARALRAAVPVGPVFFRPTALSSMALQLAKYPNVVTVETPADLRDGLRKHRGEMCVVILPWPTAAEHTDAPAWIEQLADVIAPYYWQWGPPDVLGVPVYRIAYIRSS